MIEFEHAIQINRPIEEVFAFIANFENIPKWNYYVNSVVQLDEGQAGIGTRYHQVRKTDEQIFSITRFDPPRAVKIKTTPESRPQLEMEFILTQVGSQTRVQDHWLLDTGRPAFLEKLATGSVKSAVADNLSKLKILLETGRVQLQDGRLITR